MNSTALKFLHMVSFLCCDGQCSVCQASWWIMHLVCGVGFCLEV